MHLSWSRFRKVQNFAFVLIASGLLAFQSGCATGSRRSGPVPRPDQAPIEPLPTPAELAGSKQELNDYREIQSLYNSAQYNLALQKLAAFENTYPKSRQKGHARNLRGLIYLITRKPLQAIYHFKNALEVDPHPTFRAFVRYNLAASQYEVNQLDEAERTLEEIEIARLDSPTRLKYFSLFSRIDMRKGRWLDAAKSILSASLYLSENQPRDPYIELLNSALKRITETHTLDALYSEFKNSTIADVVLYQMSTRELTNGRLGSGESHLRTLVEKYPQSQHYLEAADLLKSLNESSSADGMTIGALLPLKGKFSTFGKQTLEALELALRIFNIDQPASNITLVVEDSGDSADEAIQGLNRLFFKHRVVAVIGPILSKGIDEVTQRAEELSLPMITLSQQPGTSGDYVFHSGLTPKLQTRSIARYAIQKLGLKRFAIVYPRDRFGQQYSQAFWDAVLEYGGEVVGVESYTPGETDFRQVVDRLSGLHYQDARTREAEELAKIREELEITRRTRKTEQYFALPPIIDYQAVFIPDGPKIVGQLLPTFAYRDVEQIKFLGVSTWNSPDLLTRAQSYAEGATFVDAFFGNSDSPKVRLFMEQYESTFGRKPGVIEALAYDAAQMVEQILAHKEAESRNWMRDRLRSISRFPGVTGTISYEDGRFDRDLSVITVQNKQFLQVSR